MNASSRVPWAACAIAWAAASACGQVAHYTWEAVDDDGNWATNVVTVANRSAVPVRLWCTIDPRPPGMYFAGSGFDVAVRSIGGAGLGDTATNMLMLNHGGAIGKDSYIPFGAAFRLGDILKIDDPRDASPPGEGARWLIPNMGRPSMSIPLPDNPIMLYYFVLHLDSSLGRREVRAVPAINAQFPNGRVGVWPPNSDSQVAVPLASNPTLTINVIPAPGALLALVASWPALTLRRRGR